MSLVEQWRPSWSNICGIIWINICIIVATSIRNTVVSLISVNALFKSSSTSFLRSVMMLHYPYPDTYLYQENDDEKRFHFFVFLLNISPCQYWVSSAGEDYFLTVSCNFEGPTVGIGHQLINILKGNFRRNFSNLQRVVIGSGHRTYGDHLLTFNLCGRLFNPATDPILFK